MMHSNGIRNLRGTGNPFRRTMVGIAAASLAVATLPGQADAALVLTMQQVGADVVVNGSGTANTAALALFSGVSAGLGIFSLGSTITVGPTGALPADAFAVSGPASYGTGNTVTASSGSGDRFGMATFNGPKLVLPQAYVSGSQLTGSATFANANFVSLGVTLGTYAWTWGAGPTADSLTLNITTSEVPEPMTLGLLAVGAAGLLAARGRRPA